MIAFERHATAEKLLCVFNTSAEPAQFAVPADQHIILQCGEIDAERIGPFGAFVARI